MRTFLHGERTIVRNKKNKYLIATQTVAIHLKVKLVFLENKQVGHNIRLWSRTNVNMIRCNLNIKNVYLPVLFKIRIKIKENFAELFFNVNLIHISLEVHKNIFQKNRFNSFPFHHTEPFYFIDFLSFLIFEQNSILFY